MPDRRTRRLRRMLDAMHSMRLHQWLGRWTEGRGIVFTLHHVRPWDGRDFAPNRMLEITPEFLDEVLTFLAERGFEVVTLDEIPERLANPRDRCFAALTFDDGYRDFRDHALPVLRRHNAPASLFVTTSFADGTGDLWWVALEEAIRRSSSIELDFGKGPETISTVTTAEKYAAWERRYWPLRRGDEADMRLLVNEMASRAGFEAASLTRPLCLDWSELRALSKDPLVEMGNHTIGHWMLAKRPADFVRHEISEANARIERELGRAPRHLVYPVGDPASAGPREFEIARELGMTSAWTTRLGILFPEHRDHMTALPRVSLNGHYQERRYLEMFVSGVPFALQNRFRRLDIA